MRGGPPSSSYLIYYANNFLFIANYSSYVRLPANAAPRFAASSFDPASLAFTISSYSSSSSYPIINKSLLSLNFYATLSSPSSMAPSSSNSSLLPYSSLSRAPPRTARSWEEVRPCSPS